MISFCCESRASTQVCVFSHLLILLSLVSVLRNFRDFNLDLKFFVKTLLGLSPVPQVLEQGLHVKAFQEKFLKELKMEELEWIP